MSTSIYSRSTIRASPPPVFSLFSFILSPSKPQYLLSDNRSIFGFCSFPGPLHLQHANLKTSPTPSVLPPQPLNFRCFLSSHQNLIISRLPHPLQLCSFPQNLSFSTPPSSLTSPPTLKLHSFIFLNNPTFATHLLMASKPPRLYYSILLNLPSS